MSKNNKKGGYRTWLRTRHRLRKEVLRFEIRIRNNGKLETFHIDANSPEQARAKVGKKEGQIISIRKTNREKMLGNIEDLMFNLEPKGIYLGGGVYEDDIDIDGILGLRSKNNKRRSDSEPRT